MIYTGYFANTTKYKEAGLTTISIAGKAPSFYNDLEFKHFAPTWKIFKQWKDGQIDNFQYTEQFKEEVLNKLDKQGIKEFLDSFEQDIILLCYERPGDFCHRHIVADWLESSLGYVVNEYEVDNPTKNC